MADPQYSAAYYESQMRYARERADKWRERFQAVRRELKQLRTVAAGDEARTAIAEANAFAEEAQSKLRDLHAEVQRQKERAAFWQRRAAGVADA